MTTENQSLGYRLQELERRWAQAPDRTVLLQLAEEYGRHDRWSDAARVLQEGLEANPNHLAVRVALGRSHLRSGYAAEACQALETVIEADPMHLVANKLLVEAYLDTGQVPRARDRIDLYALLAGADPDLEHLEAEVTAGEQGLRPLPTPPAEPVPEAEAGGAVFGDLAAPGEPIAGGASSLQGLAAVGRLDSPQGQTQAESGGDPFSDLAAPPPETSPSEATSLFTLGAAGVAVASGVGATAAAGSNLAASAFDDGTASDPAQTTAPTTLDPAPFVLSEEVTAAQEVDLPFDDDREDDSVGGEAGAEASGEGEAATVTLGQLYLAQGHPERAARVFQAVLWADPTRTEARAGLADARARSGWSLTASHLLADVEGGDTESRRRALLTRYLDAVPWSGDRNANRID